MVHRSSYLGCSTFRRLHRSWLFITSLFYLNESAVGLAPHSENIQSRLAQYNVPRVSLHESILDTIGKTPIVRLQRIAPEGVNVYVKLEGANPGGSLADRTAYGTIEWAEKHGLLEPGQTIVEASTGNTGIGLAMVCAAKGYKLVAVMSEPYSVERRKIMRFFGAQVILANPAHKGIGPVIKAKELSEKHGYFFINQFENEANAWIHEQTTGPEIQEAFKDKMLDHFVMAYGSGGTFLGTSRYLRKHLPHTRLHICEPDNCPMLYSEINTIYDGDTPIPSEAHPAWHPHYFQGWAVDFIPKLLKKALEENDNLDIMQVAGFDAIETCKNLAQKEGIFSGISGGGIVCAALELAKQSPKGTSILAIVPDTGARYLSTPLFNDIPAKMYEEEQNLSLTTSSEPPPSPEYPEATPESRDFVKEQIAKHKVVLFALEYCETCWALTKFLDRIKVPYERIDIDSFKYAKDQMGNKYRSAVIESTDYPAFPMLFLDGIFVGGAVDVFMDWKKDRLQPLLDAAGLNEDNFGKYNGDPFEFLPKWMTTNPLCDK